MNWKTLLKGTRSRPGPKPKNFDGRNHFENDYSRLISSSFIRRLQDKTQVFPLHNSDFIRTRLTHSLEVSAIAKSIGKSVAMQLLRKGKMDANSAQLLPSLLWVSGLVHDLGNPPYGHFGETAIQNYFTDYFNKNSNCFKPSERLDFERFDGNVQTFRILRKLSFLGDQNSYNLTYPSLACIVKYPFSSIEGNNKGEDITKKKFGYFSSEVEDYLEISHHLGITNLRHPVTFLLEAADDIAYSAADIEDGIKLGCLNYDIIYEIFKSQLSKGDLLEKNLLVTLTELRKKSKKFGENSLGFLISKFRIETQVLMIQSVITKFLEKHDDIMNGAYRSELLLDSNTKNIRNSFKKLAIEVFSDSNVMKAEIAGYEVIKGLLNIFIPASLSSEFKSDGKDLEGRLYRIISPNLRYVYENYSKYENEKYKRFQLVVDFISGMTDTYALNYYKGLTGVSY